MRVFTFALALIMLLPLGFSGSHQVSQDNNGEISLEFLGEVLLPQDLEVGGHRIGGISGLTYEPEQDLYYAISDDLSDARFFTLRIDLSDGHLNEGDITVEQVVVIEDIDGQPFANGSLDPEGIALDAKNDLYIAAEPIGNRFPAFIRKFETSGAYRSSLRVDPLRYDPRFDKGRGARSSGGFESLTVTADRQKLFAAFEVALKQDGEGPSRENETPARILEYDLITGKTVAEYVYLVEKQTLIPVPPDGDSGIGLNDLLWVDQDLFLSLEREYAKGLTQGEGSRPVKMYTVDLSGADNVVDKDPLDGTETPVSKALLLDFDDLLGQVERIGSHEAVIFGPQLADGRRSLILIEDNDFDRPTQVLAFAAGTAAPGPTPGQGMCNKSG